MSDPSEPYASSNAERHWRWTTQPVDNNLLFRYFVHRADLAPLFDASVTGRECRYVELCLHVNAKWQAAWKELENEFGLSVPWPRIVEDPPVAGLGYLL